MKKMIIIAMMAVATNAFATNNAAFDHLREVFWNARPATQSDLSFGRSWNCQSFYGPDNSRSPLSVKFSPYDGLIKVNVYNGIGSILKDQFAATLNSGARPNELVVQTRDKFESASTEIANTYAIRVNKKGDLLVEYSFNVISGSVNDLEQMPESVVITDNYASEYWVCPK